MNPSALDRYRLLFPIGRGGAGSVFEAEDLSTGDHVAIKIVHAPGRDNQGRRLLREARVTLALDHPGAVRVREVIEHSPMGPVLVMDLLRGETLRERLRRDEQLPPADVTALIDQLAACLGEAHRLGAVHRDIKPENIFLLEGDSLQTKLLDFGIVKLAHLDESPISTTSLTAQGIVIGTVGYMPPEQLGDEPLDARTDIWALGAVAYECLSGGRPVEAAHAYQFLFRLREQGIAPIDRIVPSVPLRLAAIVMQMLEVDPRRRPASMPDVRAALA